MKYEHFERIICRHGDSTCYINIDRNKETKQFRIFIELVNRYLRRVIHENEQASIQDILNECKYHINENQLLKLQKQFFEIL